MTTPRICLNMNWNYINAGPPECYFDRRSYKWLQSYQVTAVKTALASSEQEFNSLDNQPVLCNPFVLMIVFRVQSQTELYKKHHNTGDGRIRVWLGIRQIMNATDGLLLATRDIAKELKTGIHMHVVEIAYENQFVTDARKVDHGTVTLGADKVSPK